MKKSQLPFIIFFSALAILVVLYFTYGNDSKVKYQWHESYDVKSDQPYGTKIIKELVEADRNGGKFILNEKKSLADVLSSAPKKNADYIFIGQSIYLNESDTEALLNFINDGNDAFIASQNFPDIVYKIYESPCENGVFYSSVNDSLVNMNFYHDTLRTVQGYSYAFKEVDRYVRYNWDALNKAAFCDTTTSIVPLGYFGQENVNFLKFKHGKGNLYLHSDPLVFTNFFMIQPEKTAYVSAVFSHLHGKNTIWDEYSKVPFFRDDNPNDSPLYYILQQPSLKYAWWIFLAGIFLYVFFAAKRKQRIIPVLEVKSNTSLEYVRLISSLYLENGNHLDMARKKMKYFLYFVRSKYGMQMQNVTEDQIEKLAEKSKVNVAQVKKIFENYRGLDHNLYANLQHRLEDLYYSIEFFYQNCK
jgi:hypothetical protein